MSKKKYLNPPKREDFECFTDFTDFQIVMLCEMELLRKNKKFTRLDGPNPNQLLNDFINNWKESEFNNIPFRDRASFQVDIQKIIPYNWSAFDEMSNKNHLEIFKNKLSEDELKKMDLIFSELDQKWEKDYREYKSISFLTDKEMVVRWNNERGMYDEIK